MTPDRPSSADARLMRKPTGGLGGTPEAGDGMMGRTQRTPAQSGEVIDNQTAAGPSTTLRLDGRAEPNGTTQACT
jgi:hypothetical protein